MKKTPQQTKLTQREERVKAVFPVKTGDECGVTQDISATGLFLKLPKSYEVGVCIPLQIDVETTGRTLKLSVLGEVVRIQKTNKSIGIAVRIVEQNSAESILAG